MFIESIFPSKPFQFTPLREGRRKEKPAVERAFFNFNSRPCVRGDKKAVNDVLPGIIFQFTPLREGRHVLTLAPFSYVTVFQFTPLREGRRNRQKALLIVSEFQFTPLREGRRQYKFFEGGDCIFQFTPLREGRRIQPLPSLPRPHNFNSRPCVRGDKNAIRKT